MFFQFVRLHSLGLGNLRFPLLAITGPAAAETIHEDGGAGGFLAAEDAGFGGPMQKLF